jgi:CHAT domain-containing protein
VIPLAGLTVDEVTRTASAYLRLIRHARSRPAQPAGKDPVAAELLRQVLRWLWDKIAEPVLETLGYAHRSGELPRLWWCPAGLLGLLPLHAAQRYDPGPAWDTGVIDRVVSSYTPTIRALSSARSLQVPRAREALVISAPGPLAGAPLRNTDREARAVAARLPARVTLLGTGQATVATVRGELGRHSWLHFAGHSRQNLADPGRAALLLDDGELTVLDISRLRLPPAELAFLSSCEGGLGSTRLPDEAIHLASALQIARYREVIAALWSIGDNIAADIAGEIYRELASDDRPAQGRPAVALHRTLRQLRASHSPLVWAAYCHTGP